MMRTKFWRYVLTGLAVLLALGAAGGYWLYAYAPYVAESTAGGAALSIGEPAPAFALPDKEGAVHKLSDFAGKTVVLEWTSPICEFTILKYKSGDVQSLQAKSAADGVVWLQISSAPKSNAAYLEGKSIDALISARGLTIQALLVDSTGSLGHAYGAKATPTVAIVDKSGKLAYWGGFDDSPFGDMGTAPHKYVSEALAAIVANKAPPVARARAYGCGIPYAG